MWVLNPLKVFLLTYRPTVKPFTVINHLYRGRDSNSHAVTLRFLRPVCLPFPPPRHFNFSYVKELFIVFYYDVNITSYFTKAKPVFKTFNFLFARVERFELPTMVLETSMIPFHHTRVFEFKVGIEPTSVVLQTTRLPKPT